MLVSRQERQKQNFDRTARHLPPLKPHDVIRVYKDGKLQRGVVRQTLDAPRSYVVSTETGAVIRRNRRDLIRTRETEPVCCSPMDDFDPPVSEDASVQKCARSASVCQSDSTSGTPTLTTAATPSSALQPVVTIQTRRDLVVSCYLLLASRTM